MNLVTANSNKENLKETVQEIKSTFGDFEPSMVMYFASSRYEPEAISAEMQNAFPSSSVIGCSTSGEIASGKMSKGSLVAMAFGPEIVEDIKIEVIEGIKDKIDITSAFSSFEKHYNEKMNELDFTKYLGLVLVDGLTCAEEKLMDTIGDKTDVFFTGGSAGDDLQFKATYVYANGKSYSNAAILALLKVKSGFDIIKTQSFKVIDKELVATKVDEKNREVIEFNNQPAAVAYAEMLGTSVEELPNHFMKNPLGLMIGDEPFVRSPQMVDGSSVKFYCSIMEGMELSILESANIIEETARAIEEKVAEFGEISGLANFNCILRTLDLESRGLEQEYADVFKDIPTIGFSTYGEQYLGHVNQTSTIIVFK